MLRYFVAWNFWLVAILVLLLAARESGRRSLSIFGYGSVPYSVYWFVIAIATVALVVCLRSWNRGDR